MPQASLKLEVTLRLEVALKLQVTVELEIQVAYVLTVMIQFILPDTTENKPAMFHLRLYGYVSHPVPNHWLRLRSCRSRLAASATERLINHESKECCGRLKWARVAWILSWVVGFVVCGCRGREGKERRSEGRGPILLLRLPCPNGKA